IYIICHFFYVVSSRPAVAKTLTMTEVRVIAVLAILVVVRQIFDIVLPGVGFAQIAEFPLILYAALAQETRAESGIHVRRNVPVVRYAEFKTALRGGPPGRRQQAGFALVDIGKVDPWCIKDGYALEFNAGISGGTGFGEVIQLELTGLDIPVIHVRFTSGIAGIDQALLALPLKQDFFGVAA